jgi:putative glutamine amidotransferase
LFYLSLILGEKMDFPLIGVTTYSDKNKDGYPIAALLQAYVDALVQAGAVPVLIPNSLPREPQEALFKKLDGILFSGGGDISLDYFDGEAHPSIGGVDRQRDELELSLARAAVKQEKPFFGICRGFQVVNVALGGTLYTHIQDQKPGSLKHDYYPSYERNLLAHPVKVEAGSRLASILKETELSVNSLHHQAARLVPGDLQQVAYAPDGLVEAVELPDHPFGMAVQWHPEWLTDQPAIRRLFRAFIEAAGNGK